MYRCLKKQSFQGTNGYSLVTIREEDIELIRQWRNAQIDILRQKTPLSSEQQQQYYNNVIFPSMQQDHPSQILFSFLQNGNCIGYGGLVHIDWDARRAEISFLLNPDYISKHAELYTEYLAILIVIAFENLKFHRLYAETYEFRNDHLEILEKRGFIFEGRLREHIFKRGKWHDAIIHGLLAKDLINDKH